MATETWKCWKEMCPWLHCQDSNRLQVPADTSIQSVTALSRHLRCNRCASSAERVVLNKIIWGWKAHFLNDGRYQPTFTFILLWQFFYSLWFHFVVCRYTCPFVEKFSIDIETYYKPDTGNQADVFNLSAAEKRQRTIGERTWYWSWTIIKT